MRRMRHRKQNRRLGRTGAHRKALMASLVCGLIDRKRVTTTLAKAKAARSLAERMVSLGRRGTLAARRRAVGALHRESTVAKLFTDLPNSVGRQTVI